LLLMVALMGWVLAPVVVGFVGVAVFALDLQAAVAPAIAHNKADKTPKRPKSYLKCPHPCPLR